MIGDPLGADALSASLWRERRQLELLQFRLETQLLHLNAGETQWLTFTSADLASVLENLRFETLARNVEAAALATEWGVAGEPTLPVLAAAAPGNVWVELLEEHGRAMAVLLNNIRSTIDANLGALHSAIEGLARDLELPGGTPDAADELALFASQANAAQAVKVVEGCWQPLVADFLGLAG